MPPERGGSFRLLAPALFFIGYLAVQIAYPAIPWFTGGDWAFTWRMFSGYDVETQFTVVTDDGAERPIADVLRSRPGARVRVLGPEVDQRRFLPPWLCAHTSGARSVVLRDRMTPQDTVVIPCRSIAP